MSGLKSNIEANRQLFSAIFHNENQSALKMITHAIGDITSTYKLAENIVGALSLTVESDFTKGRDHTDGSDTKCGIIDTPTRIWTITNLTNKKGALRIALFSTYRNEWYYFCVSAKYWREQLFKGELKVSLDFENEEFDWLSGHRIYDVQNYANWIDPQGKIVQKPFSFELDQERSKSYLLFKDLFKYHKMYKHISEGVQNTILNIANDFDIFNENQLLAKTLQGMGHDIVPTSTGRVVVNISGIDVVPRCLSQLHNPRVYLEAIDNVNEPFLLSIYNKNTQSQKYFFMPRDLASDLEVEDNRTKSPYNYRIMFNPDISNPSSVYSDYIFDTLDEVCDHISRISMRDTEYMITNGLQGVVYG